MTADHPGREERLAGIADHGARRARLAEQHGMPETINAAEALALAGPALPLALADDIHASIYRDGRRLTRGWPRTWRLRAPDAGAGPLPDGRVAAILDLRPGMRRESGPGVSSDWERAR